MPKGREMNEILGRRDGHLGDDEPFLDLAESTDLDFHGSSSCVLGLLILFVHCQGTFSLLCHHLGLSIHALTCSFCSPGFKVGSAGSTP